MKAAILVFLNILLLSGCATTAPSGGPIILHTYKSDSERDQIAVLRLEQNKSFKVVLCDNQPVSDSVRYVLLEPGRHELRYSIEERNILLGGSSIVNRKYLIAEKGRTYILKIARVQGEQYPEVVDVTGDPTLHVDRLPVEEIQ